MIGPFSPQKSSIDQKKNRFCIFSNHQKTINLHSQLQYSISFNKRITFYLRHLKGFHRLVHGRILRYSFSQMCWNHVAFGGVFADFIAYVNGKWTRKRAETLTLITLQWWQSSGTGPRSSPEPAKVHNRYIRFFHIWRNRSGTAWAPTW